jgi:inhibitor of KinA
MRIVCAFGAGVFIIAPGGRAPPARRLLGTREDRHPLLRKYDAQMEITPLGDCALIVRASGNSGADETLREVLERWSRLEAAKIPGVIELAPAYTTIAVFFDPIVAVEAGSPPDKIFDWLGENIRSALKARSRRTRSTLPREIEIPVCYDREFALDIEDVAQAAKLSADEIARRHTAADYRVNCVGFTPGFPFLSGLPPELATPRRATPRTKIPAGSVAIGGAQTGIYPFESPGGWNVIGRTPLQLFDPNREAPALLRAGDRVRFRVITREQFETWPE